MEEPILFGIQISLLVLYFTIYSFMGWILETVYCSLVEKRFVMRGFLFGPICPIYGVGALLMILLFSRFIHNGLVFYLVATVGLSAWEYFVGWLLETTTHIKYWDYSSHRIHLHGRISLWVSLCWGGLAYLLISFLHPAVEQAMLLLPLWLRYALCGVSSVLLVVDGATTIRKLAHTARLMEKLETVTGELRMRLSEGKAELGGRLESAVETIGEARDNLSQGVEDIVERLRARRNDLLDQAERYSRRFRHRYTNITSNRFAPILADVKAAGERLKEKLRKLKEERKAEKTARK